MGYIMIPLFLLAFGGIGYLIYKRRKAKADRMASKNGPVDPPKESV